jgi:hypothetical protein
MAKLRNRFLRSLPLITIGAFQVVVWTKDPFGVHTALNDGVPMALSGQVAAAGINGGLWFLLAAALGRRWPKVTGFLAPFAVTFTFNQWMFWWWPYLLGTAAGMQATVSEHTHQLAALPRLLPPIGDHLVPSVEHTLLQPLSLYVLWCVVNYLREERPIIQRAAADRKKWFRFGAFAFTSLNVVGLVVVVSKSGLNDVSGCLLTLAQVALGNIIMYQVL